MRKRSIFCFYLLFTILISLNASIAFSGVATLTWDAPTTNTDGTPITDLAGYKVYYGTSADNYSQNINIGNITTYTIDNLTEGRTYYFAVTAYNISGNESGFSNEAVWYEGSAGPIDLPKTSQTVSYFPGDDGYIQAGIDWPNPRFTDNGNGTLTDNLTGLMWLKDGGCMKKNRWRGSLNTIADFNIKPGNYNCLGYSANYSDWRLPNIKELESLTNYGASDSAAWLNSEGFVDVKASYYWSSTTYQHYPSYKWFVKMRNGNTGPNLRSHPYYEFYVLPVRVETSDNPYYLPKTGQTVSYFPRDDGYIQAGIDWPDPRFTDNGDGTLTDNLTGLVWLKDGGCIKNKKWEDSLNAIADFNNNPVNYNCLGYTANYSDWRLPNIKELESLTNYGVSDSAAWLNSEGFVDVNASYYWSSTTYQDYPYYKWLVKMSNGMTVPVLKSYKYYVWPVRAGKIEWNQ